MPPAPVPERPTSSAPSCSSSPAMWFGYCCKQEVLSRRHKQITHKHVVEMRFLGAAPRENVQQPYGPWQPMPRQALPTKGTAAQGSAR